MTNRTIRNPFKQRDFARIFDTMITLARDPSSEMYLKDGGQHRGAMHRCAFWDGFNGMKRSPHAPSPQSLSWACYRAGQAYAKQLTKEKA